MKTCGRCKRRKRLASFNKKKGDKLQSFCRACQHEQHAAWAKTSRARASRSRRRRNNYTKLCEVIRESKQRPCADCGVSYPTYVMDFDHVPSRGPKLFTISTHNRSCLSEETLRAEIAKCDVVCANCHRERTHQRLLCPLV